MISFGRLKADDKKYDVKVDKWTGREENGKQILHAEMEGYSVDLELEPVKPAALHGENGIVNKGGEIFQLLLFLYKHENIRDIND